MAFYRLKHGLLQAKTRPFANRLTVRQLAVDAKQG